MGCAVAQPSLGASPCARNLRRENCSSTTSANHTPITYARSQNTKSFCNSIAAACPDRWQATRSCAARFALVATARSTGSHLPIFAEKDELLHNSRLSFSSCSRTPPGAQPRLSNRNGERPSAFHFRRCENNSRCFSSELGCSGVCIKRRILRQALAAASAFTTFPNKFLRAGGFGFADRISAPPRWHHFEPVASEDLDLAPPSAKRGRAPHNRAPEQNFL